MMVARSSTVAPRDTLFTALTAACDADGGVPALAPAAAGVVRDPNTDFLATATASKWRCASSEIHISTAC